MRIDSTYQAALTPLRAPQAPASAAATSPTTPSTATGDSRFSVLNDFRYLTDTDKELLGAATGEHIEPGLTDRTGPASAFAQQLALDRRTGTLAPSQHVTGVYLRNAAAAIDQVNEGRGGFTNPYSGGVMERALGYLDSIGRGRADIRM